MRTLFPILLVWLLAGCAGEHQRPDAQFRGPERNGIFPGSKLMDQWPEEGPELLWVYEGLGRGYASPAVTPDRIYVNAERDGRSYLHALDLQGNLLWEAINGEEFLGEGFSSSYPGARSTPTVMGDLVYAASGTGRLACFQASSGEEKWAVDLIRQLGGELGYFGYSESAAVDRDHIYCFPAGMEHNVVALDRYTGEKVWSSTALRDTFAYGSPVLVDLPERPVLITTSRHHLFVLDRRDGRLLSSYRLEGFEYDGEHCNTVVYSNGSVYFVANDIPGQGALRLELSEDGTRLREIWRNREIMNNFGGLVVVADHLYTTIRKNRLVSLDPQTGQVSDSIRVAAGGLAYADGKFFCYGNNGIMTMVRSGTGGLEQGGQFRVREGSGHHFAHPVIAGEILYIRRGSALMAYRIAKASSETGTDS